MDWKGDQPTRVHLIHLATGKVTTKVRHSTREHVALPMRVALGAALPVI